MLHDDKFVFSFLVFLPPGLRIVGDWFVKKVIDTVKGMGQEQAGKAVRALQAPLLDASRAAVQGGGIAWRPGQHLFVRSGKYSLADKPQDDPNGSKWEWKEGDGWVAYLPKGIDGWLMARQASGWGHRTAVLVGIGKLLLWHLLQPTMYCAAQCLYWDTIDTTAITLAVVVLVREGIYIVECIVGLWIAPYYLLVHPGKTHGTEPSSSRMREKWLMYALMPERFVFNVILQACVHVDSTPTPTVSAATEAAAIEPATTESAATKFRNAPPGKLNLMTRWRRCGLTDAHASCTCTCTCACTRPYAGTAQDAAGQQEVDAGGGKQLGKQPGKFFPKLLEKQFSRCATMSASQHFKWP